MGIDPSDRDGANEKPTLLVVDDDVAFRESLAAAFRRRGYEVRAAGSYDEALQVCAEFVPERAVIDLRMPGVSGLELLDALKRIDPATEVLVLTGYGSIATAVEAVKHGAVNYLTKPAVPAEIEAAFSGHGPAGGEALPPTPSLDRVTWEHMQRVLADCGGNVSEAARRLGMHRRSLQRKLQKHPPPR